MHEACTGLDQDRKMNSSCLLGLHFQLIMIKVMMTYLPHTLHQGETSASATSIAQASAQGGSLANAAAQAIAQAFSSGGSTSSAAAKAVGQAYAQVCLESSLESCWKLVQAT